MLEGYLFSNADLRKLIVPVIIEQSLQSAVGLFDGFMVSIAGDVAVAGVSLVDAIFALLITTFAALGTGGAVVAGHYLGQKRNDGACRAGDQLMLFTLLLSLVVTILLVAFRDPLFQVIFGRVEPAVMDNCIRYFDITIWSVPFLAVNATGNALFRTMRNARTPMLISLVMNAAHVAGNAILLYGLGWGIEGVAVPTLVTRGLAGFAIVALLLDKRHDIHLAQPFPLRFEGPLLRMVLRIGLPSCVEGSVFQLGRIIVLHTVSLMPLVSITANAIANALVAMALFPGLAVGYAMVAVISQVVGTGDLEQVRYYVRKIMRISYAVIILSGIVLCCLMPLILQLYHVSEEAKHIVFLLILLHSSVAALLWPISFTLPNALKGADDADFVMVISVLSIWVFRAGGGYVLGILCGLDIWGVWLGTFIDWIFRSSCMLWRYVKGKWAEHLIRKSVVS